MEVLKGPFSIQNQGEMIFLKNSWNSWSNYMKSGRNFKRTGMNLIWNPILDRKRAPPRARFRSEPGKMKLFRKMLEFFANFVHFDARISKQLKKIPSENVFWIKNGPLPRPVLIQNRENEAFG